MSSIVFIMKDTGFREVLFTVYGDNIVNKIISGDQYSRALLTHTLVLSALFWKIIKKWKSKYKTFGENIRLVENRSFLFTGEIDEFRSDDIFIEIGEAIEQEMEDIEKGNLTCKLWIQNCRMVLIFIDFLSAEKMGDWDLHLECLERMLPIFHAIGYFSYAKCVAIHLHNMTNLKNSMDPKEFELFIKG